MTPSSDPSARRAFLKFLAASPLMACADFLPAWTQQLLNARIAAQEGVIINAADDWVIIRSVREALSVFDFQAVARAKVLP